jgi:hypothetical protein
MVVTYPDQQEWQRDSFVTRGTRNVQVQPDFGRVLQDSTFCLWWDLMLLLMSWQNYTERLSIIQLSKQWIWVSCSEKSVLIGVLRTSIDWKPDVMEQQILPSSNTLSVCEFYMIFYLYQVAPQLYSLGWVNPVPDPLLLRKSGSTGIRTRTSGSVARNSDH